jgi:allophanate hydrolase subunit 1
MRNLGMTPTHFKSEKTNPLDLLKPGDRVLFRVERHKKLLGVEADMYVPFAD